MSTQADISSHLREINDKCTLYKDSIDEHSAELCDLLTSLKTFFITPAEIKNAGLHLTINNLKKSINEPVANAAKEIIAHWKAHPVPTPTATAPTTAIDEKAQEMVQLPQISEPASASVPTPATESLVPPTPQRQDSIDDNKSTFKRKALAPEFILGKTESQSRNNAQKLIYNTFEVHQVDDDFRIELAVSIEAAMFKHFQGDGPDYKTRMRLILSNLKDPNNPDFIESILTGDFSPADLATLTPTEMASREAQARIAKEVNFELEKRKTDLDGGGKGVDMFQCPQCKKRNCTYTQRQTRSADEPMTIFCRCIPCGKRFKIYP